MIGMKRKLNEKVLLLKTSFYVVALVNDENSRIQIRIQVIGTDPRIRIRTKCHGSATVWIWILKERGADSNHRSEPVLLIQ